MGRLQTISKLRLATYGIVLLVMLPILFAVVSVLLGQKQISTATAQKICSQFVADAKQQAALLSGYVIAGETSGCRPTQDEMGGTDYMASTSLTIVKDPPSPLSKSDTDQLAASLQPVHESWSTQNIIADGSSSSQACIATSAYIDNDGTFIAQGTGQNSATYYSSTTDLGYSNTCLE